MNYFIFDMDGVLVDSEPMHRSILHDFGTELGVNIDKEYLLSLTGLAGIPAWEKIKNDFSLSQSSKELALAHKDFFYQNFSNYEVLAVEGIIEWIEYLKERGTYMSVAPSSSLRLIEYFTERLGIRSYFDYLVSGESVPQSKPAPDIFLKVASLYDVEPSEFWVLEDSHHGVTAAKRAGMRCIGYQNPNSGNQDLSQADVVIESISDTNLETKLFPL